MFMQFMQLEEFIVKIDKLYCNLKADFTQKMKISYSLKSSYINIMM